MNGKMRKKAGLLSRVSTLAIIAAAGSFGAAQQAQAQCTGQQVIVTAPTSINADVNCVVVNTDLPDGDITNNANVGPGDGDSGFFIGDGGIINGALFNVDTIRGGTAGGAFETPTGALTIGDGGDVTGGIFNTGQINSENGNGINLGFFGGEAEHEAALTGDITNSAGIQGGIHGIAAYFGTMSGALINEDGANIIGGDVAVFISDEFDSWTGGIFNSGNVAGDNAGIQVGDLLFDGKNVEFSGGIINNFGGTISGLNGPAIIAGGLTFSGGIDNAGLITQRSLELAGGEGTYAGVGIVVGAETFSGGITNTGQIDGLGGPAIWITNQTIDFNDGIENFGGIFGVDEGILIESENFTGNLTNSVFGQIIASHGTGAAVSADTDWVGNVDNQGLMQGGEAGGTGFEFIGQSFFGDFSNSGTVAGGFAGVWFSSKGLQIGGPAQFTNTNLIQGGEYGFAIIADGGENTLNVNFSNEFAGGENPATPTIEVVGEGGIAGVLIAPKNWNGTVNNEGDILGGAYGMVLGATAGDGLETVTNNWQGDITNSGSIDGDEIGLALFAGTYGGESGNTITNAASGVITGSNTGMLVSVDTFTGDIDNAGTIFGSDTGLFVSVDTFNGTITNTGLIEGGGFTTGLHIVATNYNGDIINDGELTAAGNTLHVDIENLNGTIVNDVNGVITADFEQTAVLLEIDDETATFINRGEIDGNVLLNGDFLFEGKAALTFVGESGGIAGDITGQIDTFSGDANDFVLVRTGTHYFVEQVDTQFALFSHTATNLAAFTIDDGGTALMGATAIGATDGTGYAFDNVGALNVVDGTLYIDNHTILGAGGESGDLGTYTQSADGRTMFFLLAPDGDDPTVAGVHYGQINADGLVTLDGTISAFLDPVSFAATSLDEIAYEDVITGGSLTGDFTTAELFSQDSIFLLNYEINGLGSSAGNNTVDLLVTRVDLSHLGNIDGLVIKAGDLFDSSTAERMSGGSGGCGISGLGWCRNMYAQNDIGAGQVMTDATPGLDPFDWLRTGVRRVGETAAWGRALGSWGESDGDVDISPSDWEIFGGIVGIDHVFTPTLLAGVAAQYTAQDVEFEGRPDHADIDSLEIGGYVSLGDTRLYLNANASVIFHDFEVTRFVGLNQAFGDYDGTTISAYLESGKIFETDEGFRIQPLIALSYAHLETDAYTETGTALTLLSVSDSDFDSLKGMAGARVAYPIPMDSGRRFVPEVRFLYAHEFMDDQSSFIASDGGPPQIVFGEEISRETFVVGGGFTAPLSDATSLYVDYDAGLNADITTHTVSGGLRTRW